MKKLLLAILSIIPTVSFADRLGALNSNAQVILSTQAVQISSGTGNTQPGAFKMSSGTVNTFVVGTQIQWPDGTIQVSSPTTGGGGSVTSVTGTNGITTSGTTSVVVSVSSVSLSTQVVGNLPVTKLNSGTGASASTFWRGDGTWVSSSTFGGSSVTLASTQTWTGQNNWTTPAQSTFTYGLAVGSLTVSGGAGNLSFVNVPDSLSYQIIGSSSAATHGTVAIFGSSNTIVPSGLTNTILAVDSNGVLTSTTVTGGTSGSGAGVIAGTGNLYDTPYVSVASSNTLSMSSNVKIFPSSVTIMGKIPVISTETLQSGTTIFVSSGTINQLNTSTLTLTGGDWPTFTRAADSTAYRLLGSSTSLTVGHYAAFSSTSGAIVDGGAAGTGDAVKAATQTWTGGNTFQSSTTFTGLVSVSTVTVGSATITNLSIGSRILIPTGTNSAPSIGFFDNPTSGIYQQSPGGGIWWLQSGGTQIAGISAAGITLGNGQFLANDGSVSAPSIAFNAGVLGFYRIGANDMGLATNGIKAMEWDSNQLVTIPKALIVSTMTASSATITSLITGTSYYASYTSSGTITPDARLGNNISIVLASSATINVPSNASDLQMFRYRITQDATGSRSVTLGSGFRFGDDVTTWAAGSTANKTDYLGCIYNASAAKCDVVSSSLRGY